MYAACRCYTKSGNIMCDAFRGCTDTGIGSATKSVSATRARAHQPQPRRRSHVRTSVRLTRRTCHLDCGSKPPRHPGKEEEKLPVSQTNNRQVQMSDCFPRGHLGNPGAIAQSVLHTCMNLNVLRDVARKKRTKDWAAQKKRHNLVGQTSHATSMLSPGLTFRDSDDGAPFFAAAPPPPAPSSPSSPSPPSPASAVAAFAGGAYAQFEKIGNISEARDGRPTKACEGSKEPRAFC